MYAEKEAKRQLAEKVAQLESRMNVNHTQREAELERLLQQVHSSSHCFAAHCNPAGKKEGLLNLTLSVRLPHMESCSFWEGGSSHSPPLLLAATQRGQMGGFGWCRLL